MKTEVKKLDKTKRILKVEVFEDVLAKDRDSIYKELAKNLKVPGFRPGAAPVDVIQKHHGPALQEEFLRRQVPLYYSKALDDNNLEPASAPRIYDVDITSKKLVFSAEFEVKPQVELQDSDYKGLNIKGDSIEVEAIEIEKLMTQFKDKVKKIADKDFGDEDLAKWAGYSSLDGFKKAIKAEILVDKLRERKRVIENFIMEELIKRIKIEVPPSLVADQHGKLMQQEMYNLRMRGVKDDDIKKYEKDIDDKLKPLAEKQVKLYYILEAIVKKEALQTESSNLFEAALGYILCLATIKD